jgi:bifunctional DNA-binding transcriptional regulator/antitoxin component of YhaV-PrlF toxin-antitoxin module
LEVEIKTVDSHGRVSLPPDWRREVLGDGSEVVILRRGEELTIRPRKRRKLSEYFDSVEVDIESDLSDWHAVKRELLRREAA